MHAHSKAVCLLLLTALLWSTGGVLIKWMAWHPLAIAGMRSAVAALFLWAVLGRPRFAWTWVQLSGAAAHAASVVLFVTATSLTTAANAIVLTYTAPIYVALGSGWVLGESVTRGDWWAIGAVLVGMAFFFLDQLTLAGWWGNMCAMGAGLAFAWLVLAWRHQAADSPLAMVLLGNVMAALVGLPFMFTSLPPLSTWVALGLAGSVQLGLSFVLYRRAMPHVSAVEAVLIPAIEPLLNPLWVFLSLGETPGGWAMVGGALVIVAITWRGMSTARATPLATLP